MDGKRGDQVQANTNKAVQFEQVLYDELKYFEGRGRFSVANLTHDEATEDVCDTAYPKSVVAEANKARLTGLAFSGGGIRSATFNLGVLQALAKLELLKQFDYLSTVSGGGYIGSWLAAWTRRKDLDLEEAEEKTSPGERKRSDEKASIGLDVVACELASSIGAGKDEEQRAAMQPDPAPIWHLREYSNYLSPRKGFWSTDAWTLGVTYIRNLVLTLSLLLATLLTLVLGMRTIATVYFKAAYAYEYEQYEIAYVLAPVLFWLSIFCASLLAGKELCGYCSYNRNRRDLSYWSVSFTLLAAASGALWLWHGIDLSLPINSLKVDIDETPASLIPWALSQNLFYANNVACRLLPLLPIGTSYLAGWFIGCLYGKIITRKPKNTDARAKPGKSGTASFWYTVAVPIAINLPIFIGLLWLLGSWMEGWFLTNIEPFGPSKWRIVVWGAPLFVLIFSIVAVIFVGVSGTALRELEREWLGRFFAVLFKWTALTTFLMVLVVYSYSWIEWLSNQFHVLTKLGVSVTWGMLSAAGVVLARNVMIGKSTGQGWLKKAILAIAPFVFILGMLILTVWATERGVRWVVREFNLIETVNGGLSGYWHMMANVDARVLGVMCAVTFVITLFWSYRLGVNLFSLHTLYGDRLIRAYLGASNSERNAHPFTGFSGSDNSIHLSELSKEGDCYSGPYPIFNAAINLVSSQRLAWQKRKAASFTFTPQYCGYEFCGEEDGTGGKHTKRVGGFVNSSDYAGDKNGKGLSLGQAMTISGAAASPNMGYHSSPALTFLMTTFNVRLGWWLPNTARDDSALLDKPGPPMGLLYFLYELLGLTNARRDYVYLSDGGHFENLGIYELVRRRCRIVFACDSEADPNMIFSGLGNAIEKCRTDLGVSIDIDVSQIKPDPSTGRSLWHCAVGCIRYSDADSGQADGTLVYLKASLTGDETLDVATYASSHACFPHETTADQWFDETQFESYRMLGEHIVQKALGNPVNVASSVNLNIKKRIIDRVILEAGKQWYPANNARAFIPSDHDALLESIVDTLRTDNRLAFLDGQLYPNLQKVADDCFSTHQHSIPEKYGEFRAGFYFCKRLIQFMQQVYYDRQLDLEYDEPRNRGWMNLFRRWSWSRMLRFTWTITAGTYGARFQSFCEHRLSLESGEPAFSEKSLEISATRGGQRCVELKLQPDTSEAEAFEWKDAEKKFGLHYYETRLIREFIEAYVHHEDFKDLSEPLKFSVFTVKVTTDDVIKEQPDHDIELNAGILIAGPPLKKYIEKTSDSKPAILYFRIRPSMRNMDLARTAFLKRLKHKTLMHYSPCLVDVDDLPKSRKESKAAWERRAYRDIHFMDRESFDHCRWFSALLDEVAEGVEEAEGEEKHKDG